MSEPIEIIDPEGEKLKKKKTKFLLFSILLSFALFSFPVIKDFQAKWSTLQAARKLAAFLNQLKTQAMIQKKPLEAKFIYPETIEIYEVSSCGFNPERKKTHETKLSSFCPSIVFVSENWIRSQGVSNDPVLTKFCYDPLYGSSLLADGIAHGSIFLSHVQNHLEHDKNHIVEILVEGSSANILLK